jgi:hypothetical protein
MRGLACFRRDESLARRPLTLASLGRWASSAAAAGDLSRGCLCVGSSSGGEAPHHLPRARFRYPVSAIVRVGIEVRQAEAPRTSAFAGRARTHIPLAGPRVHRSLRRAHLLRAEGLNRQRIQLEPNLLHAVPPGCKIMLEDSRKLSDKYNQSISVSMRCRDLRDEAPTAAYRFLHHHSLRTPRCTKSRRLSPDPSRSHVPAPSAPAVDVALSTLPRSRTCRDFAGTAMWARWTGGMMPEMSKRRFTGCKIVVVMRSTGLALLLPCGDGSALHVTDSSLRTGSVLSRGRAGVVGPVTTTHTTDALPSVRLRSRILQPRYASRTWSLEYRVSTVSSG